MLGALLVRQELIHQIASVLNREDFFMESHRLLFDTLSDINNLGSGELDAMRVIHFLQDRDLLEKAGGAPYILRLVEDVMSPSNALMHSRRLRNLSLRRALVHAAKNIETEAMRPHEDEHAFLKKVEDEILKITNKSFVPGIASIKDMKAEFSEYLEKLIQSRGAPTGNLTYFRELDHLTSGLHTGELIILAARPSMGKTTLAMNIAANMAMQGGKNVLIYSLEMSRSELLMRMLCAETQINHSDLKRGIIPSVKHQDLLAAMDNIFTSPISIDETGTLDIWDCIVRTRKFAVELANRGEKLGLIVVDYLQLMSDTQSRKQGRQFEVASVSRNLKQLAKTVGAPVLALSQMNRSVEQRRGDSARPVLSDLRESGAIEQDADIVMFIHREMTGDPTDPEFNANKERAEIIIAKHRNGPTDSFKLSFRSHYNRFDDLDPALAESFARS